MTISVLTGRSGIGKSAAIPRPLRWLCLNESPDGEWRTWGREETKVTAEFDNTTHHLLGIAIENFQCHEYLVINFSHSGVFGTTTRIARVRSDKTNHYEMNGEVYKIGKDRKVPGPIADYLRMADVNFSGQHSLPFLLGMNKTPFELARTMNLLANMEQIDEAFARINTRCKQEQGEVKSTQEEVGSLNTALEKYGEVAEIEALLMVAEAMDGEAEEQKRQAEEMRKYSRRLEEIEREKMRYKGLEEVREEVQNVLDKVQSIGLSLDEMNRRILTMKSYADSLECAASSIGKLYREIAQLQKEREREEGVMQACPLCGKPFAKGEGEVEDA